MCCMYLVLYVTYAVYLQQAYTVYDITRAQHEECANLEESESLLRKTHYCPSRDDKAPLFHAEAFVKGTVKNIRLTDYLGKWVVLFFYSSDFTFV